MTHILRPAGLVLALVLAAAALASPAASAAPKFTTEAGEKKVQVTAELATGAKDEFHFDFGILKCLKTEFKGEMVNGAEQITFTPSYSSCSMGGATASIDMNGCDYVMFAGGWLEDNCPTGFIKITSKLCEIFIFQNEKPFGLTFTEGINPNTGHRDITVKEAVENFRYEEQSPKCAKPEKVTNNGKIEGTLTLNGLEGGFAANIDWDA